jgi:pimeloyl-ACP methyl ester carboxylesterase
MAALTESQVDTRVGKVQVRLGGEHAGRPVVYLHSATGEGAFLPFLEQLADRVDVVAPAFPGFGESEGIEQIDDMEDATFHLLDLWDQLALDAPAVVGLSLGAWMAVELATRYPERVGALVLVSPVGLHIPDAPVGDIFGRSPGEMAEDLFHDQSHPMAQLMHSFDDYRSDPARMGELTFEMVKPVLQSMSATARLAWDPYLHDPKLRKRLHRVTAPTLVVRGAHDTLLPRAHAEVYASEIPGARLVELPDAAHLAPVERPEALVELVAAFLEGDGS